MLANLAIIAAGESPPSPSQLDPEQDVRVREIVGMNNAVVNNRPPSNSINSIDQSWPDLGNSQNSFKSTRSIHSVKDTDEKSSKSKSCDSSDEDSLSVPAAPLAAEGDQVVPLTPPPEPPAREPVCRMPEPRALPDLRPDPRLVDPRPDLALARTGGDLSPQSDLLPPQQQQSQFPSRNIAKTHSDSYSDSGWLDSDLKVSNNFLEEDDLGFDPFHETQKALAEMLESESKAAETVVPTKVPSPEPDWRLGSQQPTTTRPPPGFHTSIQQQQIGSSGLGGSLFIRTGAQNRPAPGFGLGGNNSSNDLLGHGLLGNLGKSHEQSRLLMDHKAINSGNDGFSMKDWQDGLRALLPNVNVSFGNGQQPHNNHSQQQQQPPASWSQQSSGTTQQSPRTTATAAATTATTAATATPIWASELSSLQSFNSP